MAEMKFGASFNEVGVSNSPSVGAQRQMANIASKAEAKQREIKAVGDTAKGAIGIYTAHEKATKIAEAETAKGDYIGLTSSAEYRDRDAVGKKELLETVYKGLPNMGKAYSDTFMGYSAGEYNKQYDGAKTIQDTAKYNASSSSHKAWTQEPSNVQDPNQDYSDTEADIEYLTNEQAGTDVSVFTESYAKDNNISRIVVGRALMAEAYSEAILEIQSAPATQEGLDAALLNNKDIMQPFESPMFMGTKEKVGKEYITALEKQRQTAKKAKEKEIKLASKSRIAQVEKSYESDDVLGPPPTLVEKDIVSSTSDDLAALKQYQALEKKYKEQEIRVGFKLNNIPGEQVTGNVPKEAKAMWQKEVNKSAAEAIVNSDYTGYINIVNFSPNESKEMGNNLYQGYLQAKNSKDAKPLMDFIKVTRQQPGGATALRQSLGDDNYAELITTQYVANSRFDGDLMKAREWVQRGDANVTDMKMPMDMSEEIKEYALTLGSQSDAYLTAINKMWQVDKGVAIAEYKNMAEYYKDQTEVIDGVKIDKSMSDFKATIKSPNPDDVMKRIKDQYEKQVGTPAANVTYLAGGQILITDSLNGFAQVLDGGAIDAESSEAELEKVRVKEAKKKLDSSRRKKGEGSIAGTIDQLKDLPVVDVGINAAHKGSTGLFGSIGTLFSRLGSHMKQQAYDSLGVKPPPGGDTQPEVTATTPLEKKSAGNFLMNAINQEQAKKPIEKTKPAFNTLSLTDNMNWDAAIERNRVEHNRLNALKIVVEEASLVTQEDRVGYQKHLGFKGGGLDGKVGPGTYKAIVKDVGSKKLADEVVDELYQDRLGAIGKYQFIPAKFDEVATALGYTDDTKFTPEVQEEMFEYTLNKAIQQGSQNADDMGIDDIAESLAQVWASLPDFADESYYEGNRVAPGHTYTNFKAVIQDYLDTGDMTALKEYVSSGEAVGGSYDSKNAGTATNSKGNLRIMHPGTLEGLSSMTFRDIKKRR